MQYKSIGETAQVVINNAKDLMDVIDLDDTHWVATSAPIEAFHLNKNFLAYLDSEKDGRISVNEVKDSLRWFFSLYKSPVNIKLGSDLLDIDELKEENRDYKDILDVYKYILDHNEGVKQVLIEDVVRLKDEIQAIVVQQSPIVKLNTLETDELKEYFADIIAIHGGCEHPAGGVGVSVVSVNEFQNIIAQWLEWQACSEISGEDKKTEVFPFADKTPEAYAAFKNVEAKIDHFFALCDLIRLDPQQKKNCWPMISDAEAADLNQTVCISSLLQKSAICEPSVDKTLLFDKFINPAYADLIDVFYKTVFLGIFRNQDSMDFDKWKQLKKIFLPYERWLAAKPETDMSEYSKEKLRYYLESDISKKALDHIESIPQPTVSFEQIKLTEKLMLFRKYFLRFANNYVAMTDIYDSSKLSILEEGVLIMDGRRFNLAIRVFDRKQHMQITKNSSTYVMYVKLTHVTLKKELEVAVPLARGMSGHIIIGKRGVFKHIDGTIFQAEVVQIVEFPVSFLDAILKPFQKLGSAITVKIDSLAANAEKKLVAATDSLIDPEKKVAATTSNQTAGMIAGGGFAIAAIGSSLAFMTKTLSETQPSKILIFIACLILAMLIPLSIVAFIRLARRDVSCLFEGAGWAINPRLRITKRMKKYISEKTTKTILFGIRF